MTARLPAARGPGRPVVSVIVPCVNQGHFLADALASVARQTYAVLDRLALHARTGDWRLVFPCLPTLFRYHPVGLLRRIVRRRR